MTERRPHWDDDLINAVFRIMDNYAAEVWRRVVDHGTPTFDIIAAVEDWHKAKRDSRIRTHSEGCWESEGHYVWASVDEAVRYHRQTEHTP